MVRNIFGIPQPWQQLRREMDRLMSNMFDYIPDGLLPAGARSLPALNVWEEGEALKVEAELPGVRADDLEISVAGGELTLKVGRPDVEQADVKYHRRERSVGTFVRVLRLPVEVDVDRVQADLRNGVLTITLPKTEAAKPRKISVSAG